MPFPFVSVQREQKRYRNCSLLSDLLIFFLKSSQLCSHYTAGRRQEKGFMRTAVEATATRPVPLLHQPHPNRYSSQMAPPPQDGTGSMYLVHHQMASIQMTLSWWKTQNCMLPVKIVKKSNPMWMITIFTMLYEMILNKEENIKCSHPFRLGFWMSLCGKGGFASLSVGLLVLCKVPFARGSGLLELRWFRFLKAKSWES